MRLLLFLLLYVASPVFAQQLSPYTTTAVEADSFIGYDKFGFMYFIESNTLHKSDGIQSAQYQNLSVGHIGRVDLSNPLKIVLLYPDFNSAVLLDNQLNEIALINFSVLNEPIVVTATGNASQNRLWFYDSLSMQIGLYDTQTNGYVFLTQPIIGTILHWETDFNYFQWIDNNGKRYAVDIYGKITDMGKVPEFDSARFVSDNTILYTKDNQLWLYSTDRAVKNLIDTDPNSFKSFSYKDQILSIFTNHTITNYKITIP